MRVLVVTSDVPLVEGGHRVIARALVRALREEGHEAEIVRTPQNRFGRQLSAYLATRLTDVGVTGDGTPVDAVISTRFPSFAVRHPHHVVWMNHRMREYYDLWPTFRETLGARARVVEAIRRRLLHAVDRRLLRRRRVFAQSETIRRRLERWGGIPAEVLYPPAPQRPYRCDSYDGAVLSVARLQPLKRNGLLLEGAARVPGLQVRIAGEGPERTDLEAAVEASGMTDRVEFLGHLTERALVDEYARCSAVWFGARAEDYGLVTLEAYASVKPVLTCNDSGGPAELVEHDVTGLVGAPTAENVAAMLQRIRQPGVAETLGAAAAARVAAHSWSDAVSRLLRAATGD